MHVARRILVVVGAATWVLAAATLFGCCVASAEATKGRALSSTGPEVTTPSRDALPADANVVLRRVVRQGLVANYGTHDLPRGLVINDVPLGVKISANEGLGFAAFGLRLVLPGSVSLISVDNKRPSSQTSRNLVACTYALNKQAHWMIIFPRDAFCNGRRILKEFCGRGIGSSDDARHRAWLEAACAQLLLSTDERLFVRAMQMDANTVVQREESSIAELLVAVVACESQPLLGNVGWRRISCEEGTIYAAKYTPAYYEVVLFDKGGTLVTSIRTDGTPEDLQNALRVVASIRVLPTVANGG